MRVLLLPLLLAAGLTGLAACKSKDTAPEPSAGASSVAIPCTCGDPLTDFTGCQCASCSKGQRNPGNPLCVCGTLDINK
jgi:hypothetical protein